MKLGILFYLTGYTIDPTTLAVAVEEAGFESFWVPEHGVLPVEPGMPYPMTGGRIPDVYGQMADPFVSLAFVAAATRTLKIGTCVAIVPERHPLSMAKSVATLDNFSGGRLVLGVGTGWMRAEIEAYGTDFDTRWTYTRESLEAMKVLWRDGVGGYDGKLVRFADVICDPKPAQRPHPPIVFGAQVSEATFRRIATLGDGWIAMGVTPEQLATHRRTLAAECEKVGRDPNEIEISVGVRDATPDIQEAFEAAGADRLIISLYNHPGTRIPMDQWAQAAVDLHSSGPPTPRATLDALGRIDALAGL